MMDNLKKKQRILVLTDISTDCAEKGEPDDTQSLIRLLLYSDVFDIRGLVATYTPHCGRARPDFLSFVIRAYEKAYPNLLQRSTDYISPEKLYAVTAKGSDSCGAESVGKGKSTSGSEQICKAVSESEEPLWILVWGGVTDLLQALTDAEQRLRPEEFEAFKKKIRVYSIDDQYDDCGPKIRKLYPELFYLTAYSCYRGMYRMGDPTLCDTDWVQKNVKPFGPMGEAYPVYDGGDLFIYRMGNVRGMKEGDTPTFLRLIPNGLHEPMHPEYSSWGGLFRKREGNLYFDEPVAEKNEINRWASVYRWREDFQNDFAMRIRWSAGECLEVRYPQLSLKTEKLISVSYDEELTLSAESDESCTMEWFYDAASGDFRDILLLNDRGNGSCTVCAIAPNRLKSGGQVHLIVRAKTKTDPCLISYGRVILQVLPK